MNGDSRETVDLSAISPSDLARLIAAMTRSPFTEEMIRTDIAAGAPVRQDGRINLLHYLAWMLRERRRDRPRRRRSAPPSD